MNKPVRPAQLELVDAGLPNGQLAIPTPDTLEYVAEAKRQIAQAQSSDSDDFDWNTDDSIILKEQRATAAYRNRKGELIIRQQAGWCDDGDTFVYISPENEIAFMEGLAAKARE